MRGNLASLLLFSRDMRLPATPSIDTRPRKADSPLPPALRLFCALMVSLTLADLASVALCRFVLHLKGFPYGEYLLPSDSAYADLRMFTTRFHHFHSASFFAPQWGSPYLYPAAIAPLYKLFFLFPHALVGFFAALVAILLAVGLLLFRALRRHGVRRSSAAIFVLVSGLFSYPFFFEANRANMELYVWLFSALGVYAIYRDRPWMGAALIGAAAALKIYPLIYFGLLLSRKQYRQFVFGLFSSAVVTLASLWAVCPNILQSCRDVRTGLKTFEQVYVLHYRPVEIGVDHSLFGLLKRVLGPRHEMILPHLLLLYLAAGALFGLAIYFFRIRNLPYTNQVLCLSIACILLPPTSYDYTLLSLYTPWALLVLVCVDAYRSGRRLPGLSIAFVLFGSLMSSQGEFISHGDRLGGQIKAVTLCLLLLWALRYRFPLSSELNESEPLYTRALSGDRYASAQ